MRVEAVQPGREKALGKHYSSLLPLEGGLQKKPGEGLLFKRAFSDRMKGNGFRLENHKFRLDC